MCCAPLYSLFCLSHPLSATAILNTKNSKMKIGLDLDGTVYDTLGPIYTLDKKVRMECGYEPLSKEKYRRVFQSEDWHKLCIDFGIKEEDIQYYRNRLEQKIKKMEPPHLIPNGKEAMRKIEMDLGLEHLCIVTNGHIDGIKSRFKRDGFFNLLNRVRHPYEGKADVLFEIGIEDTETEFVYVGDLVSDGRACAMARDRGAVNIKFCAITHQYAMNLPEALHGFVEDNDFAFCIESINELEQVWNNT